MQRIFPGSHGVSRRTLTIEQPAKSDECRSAAGAGAQLAVQLDRDDAFAKFSTLLIKEAEELHFRVAGVRPPISGPAGRPTMRYDLAFLWHARRIRCRSRASVDTASAPSRFRREVGVRRE